MNNPTREQVNAVSRQVLATVDPLPALADVERTTYAVLAAIRAKVSKIRPSGEATGLEVVDTAIGMAGSQEECAFFPGSLHLVVETCEAVAMYFERLHEQARKQLLSGTEIEQALADLAMLFKQKEREARGELAKILIVRPEEEDPHEHV